MPDIKLAAFGNLQKELDRQTNEVASAIYEATDDVAAAVKKRFRQQVTSAGLGNRLAKTWRHRTYPGRNVLTLEPAALIWSKAPQIVSAFSSGDPIRSTRPGGFLAIPTDFAPATRKRGARGRRMSMEDFLETFGLDSLKVFSKPGSGNRVFYAIAERGFRRSGGKKRRSRLVKQGGRIKSQPVLMYVLVKQVRLAKRFDIDSVAAIAEQLYIPRVVTGIARRLGQ
ncbi:hypothetical protein IWQ52_004134 [Labrenzia sp. EL_159]|nr:hypothetical protein [Labrenzia sp. EL_162]MBG6196598.1 hypothetical protein [Labrenzia sp. EL_159]